MFGSCRCPEINWRRNPSRIFTEALSMVPMTGREGRGGLGDSPEGRLAAEPSCTRMTARIPGLLSEDSRCVTSRYVCLHMSATHHLAIPLHFPVTLSPAKNVLFPPSLPYSPPHSHPFPCYESWTAKAFRVACTIITFIFTIWPMTSINWISVDEELLLFSSIYVPSWADPDIIHPTEYPHIPTVCFPQSSRLFMSNSGLLMRTSCTHWMRDGK